MGFSSKRGVFKYLKSYRKKMKLKKYRFLALIIVLFLLTRMILIYTSPDTYDPEACVIGNTASELLEGLKQPYNQYPFF